MIKIGEGSNGSIYVNTNNSTTVIKIIEDFGNSDELKILHKLKNVDISPKVLKTYLNISKNILTIEMERLDGTLAELILKGLSLDDRKELHMNLTDLVNDLNKDLKICHNDINLNNIMYKQFGKYVRLYLIDFSRSSFINKHSCSDLNSLDKMIKKLPISKATNRRFNFIAKHPDNLIKEFQQISLLKNSPSTPTKGSPKTPTKESHKTPTKESPKTPRKRSPKTPVTRIKKKLKM